MLLVAIISPAVAPVSVLALALLAGYTAGGILVLDIG
jgi:hypothetical protein